MEKILGLVMLAVIGMELTRREHGLAPAIGMGAVVLVGLECAGSLQYILGSLSGIVGRIGLWEAHGRILLKTLGIGYLSELAAAICQDAGANALREQVCMLGRCSMLAVSLPVLLQLLEALAQMGGI